MSQTYSKVDIIQAILTNQSLGEDEKKFLVEEFIDEIKREYPDLKNHATKADVTETELKLTLEIENTKREIKDLDVKLTKEIKDLDVKLTKEIKDLDVKLTKEIQELDVKISNTKLEIIKWVAGMMFAQVIALATIFLGAFKLFLH